MNLLIDSLWRAAAYCVHPRVILLSLAPLALMAALALVLGYFFWDPAIDAMNGLIASWGVTSTVAHWLDSIGMTATRGALGPMLVVLLSTPIIVVAALLAVASTMTPAMVRIVALRRFPLLASRHGGSLTGSVWLAIWTSLAALGALLVSVPLMLVPPLMLIVPPVIWGWLTYRLLSYDVLAEHASSEERRALMAEHRGPLFVIGLATGYLGAAPSLVWVSGVLAVVLAPVLLPLAIWVYTLVFAFSALWFAHYALAALESMREHARASGARADATSASPAQAPPPALPPAGAPR